MALYASGRTTGTVLGIGEGVTTSVTIYEGYVLPHAVQKSDLAGAEITKSLKKRLIENGLNIHPTEADWVMLQRMKEKNCYVAQDFDKEFEKPDIAKEFVLEDGTKIPLGVEQFWCPEILFKPSMAGRESKGIHDMVADSILKGDVDIRHDLTGNIVLHGGTTMLPGFHARFDYEVKQRLGRYEVVTIATPQRGMAAWLGASILGSISEALRSMWISKEEYDEVGPAVVRLKCF